MIPVRLELTNFLAYRNPAPLDFTGIHVAVLAGENGAGKSSLLDAITWALWGRARARTDAELVHAGQSEMRVAFTFALGDQTYRVVRAKRVGKGASAVLDLQARDTSGGWNTIAEATVLKTQDKVNRLLRLTYDTFVNSAYLVQGRADEFTGKPPNKRKEVLADILGLQEWERYEERAKERARALDGRLTALDAVLAEIESDLGRRAEYTRELAETQARALEVAERLRQAEEGWARIDAARQAVIRLQGQIDDLTRRIRAAEDDLAGLRDELAQARARADTAGLAQELEAVQARLDALQALDAEREQAAAARQALGEQSAELRARNEAVRQEGDALNQRIQAAQLEGERVRQQLKLAAEAAARALRDQAAASAAETAQFLQRREVEARAEADRLLDRARVLAEATEPLCPTCGQPLTGTARDQLLLGLNEEVRQRQARLEADLAEAETQRGARQFQLDQQLAMRDAQLARDLDADAAERGRHLSELEVQRDERRETYRGNQGQLRALTEQAAALDRRLAELAEALRARPETATRAAELRSAMAQAGQAEARCLELEARLTRWSQNLERDVAQRAALETEADQFTEILRDSAARQQALDQLRQEDGLVRARLGAAQQKLTTLDALERQREQRLAERGRLAAEHGQLEELRQAFGKKGVPAMIIETAVPEIEAAANALLGRMTGGRMNVRIDTQRETQGGEVRETLDIQVADELGTRAFENFSGGERFRIDFAIRVALSQLLARRAGTRLQTLIIDEGFGVLDAAGRERLVEAINAAQQDFQRILVVTHIDELKDSFPARIEITKGPEGSEIAVV